MKICGLCGRFAECEHHLVFGRGLRALAEEDRDCMVMPLCNDCHTLATKAIDRIHGNPVAEKLSKMLGQALWERWYLGDYGDADTALQQARQNFIERYGRSYL